MEALGDDAVARAGGVRYLADGTNPLTPQRIGITVTGAGKIGTGSVVVKKKGCEDAPPCEGAITPLQVTLKELKRNEVTPDPCSGTAAGVFRPLAIRENPVSPFGIQPCFDRQTRRWRFGVSSLEIKVLLDICDNNLLGYRVVNDVSTLTANEACNALHDISGHFYYPVRTTLGYVFRSILVEHEKRHKQDYEEALKNVMPEFEKRLREISIRCEEAGSRDDAVDKARNEMTVAVNSFLNKIYDEYRKKTSEPDYEQKTQSSLLNDVIAMRNQLLVKCAGGTQ